MAFTVLSDSKAAPDTTASDTQVWTFASASTQPFRGAMFMWTNATTANGTYVNNGLLGVGFADGTNNVSTCVVIRQGVDPTYGTGSRSLTKCIRMLNTATGALEGEASITSTGNGTFTLTYSTRLPEEIPNKKYIVACLAFFGDAYIACGETNGAVTGLTFAPDLIVAARANTGANFSLGFASKRPGPKQRCRATYWKPGITAGGGFPQELSGYVSNTQWYALIDKTTVNQSMVLSNFTVDGVDGTGAIQNPLYFAIGHRSGLSMDGGAFSWLNGYDTGISPFSVTGVLGQPFFIIGTYGKVTALNTVTSTAAAEAFGIGFTDQNGASFNASMKLQIGSGADPLNSIAKSQTSAHMCNVETVTGGAFSQVSLDLSLYLPGSFDYDLNLDVSDTYKEAYQATLLGAPSTSTVGVGACWLKGGTGSPSSWLK